jgi:hypothetical protein
MWTKTLETQFELTLETEAPQIFHHLVYHRECGKTELLRLNIHSVDEFRRALLHYHNEDAEQLDSKLLFEHTEIISDLEHFITKMQAKADDLIEKPRKTWTHEIRVQSGNWSWELVDSELTEFGVEESWDARWKSAVNPIVLHVNLFKGNHHTIPSFVSVEIVQGTKELHYFEMPFSSYDKVRKSIEHKVEDLVITPMDMLVHLILKSP